MNYYVLLISSVWLSVEAHEFVTAHPPVARNRGALLDKTSKTIEIPSWAQSPYDDANLLPPRLDDDRPILPRHRDLFQQGKVPLNDLNSLGGGGGNSGLTGPNLDGRPTLLRHFEDGSNSNSGFDDLILDPIPRCPSPDFEPCVDDREIAEQMKKCCDSRSQLKNALTPKCSSSLCAPDTPLETFVEAVNVGDCTWPEIQHILQCAVSEQDATECCDQKGVTDEGRANCGEFCNPMKTHPDLAASLFRCTGKPFDSINKCYKAQFNYPE